MSKKSAPGTWADRNSTLASRPAVGRCQLASSTATSGAVRCSASQSVDTSHFDNAILLLTASAQGDADAAVLLALALEFADRDVADLARRSHMRASAWLQIDGAALADAHEPYS